MCWFHTATICATLVLASFAQGLIVVGPNTFRSNQHYTVAFYNMDTKRVTVAVRLECFGNDDSVTFNQNKLVEVASRVIKNVAFKIPHIPSTTSGKISIDGINGFVFTKTEKLEYNRNSTSGFIQLSKPVYKPGDSVQFRVIVLDPDLKPPSGLKMVTVNVQDPADNTIRKWTDALLYNGVFEGQLNIAPSPLLGTYSINVIANDEELVSKSFEVKEYVLSTFEVHVKPTVVPLEEHDALYLTIVANYYSGKPVVGRAKFQLYGEDNKLELSKEFDVDGRLQVHLPFANKLNIQESEQDVKVNVFFTERYTNQTVFLQPSITVYKQNYKVRLLGNTLYNPSKELKLVVEYQNDKPAEGVRLEVNLSGDGYGNDELIEHVSSYTSDKNGIITIPKMILMRFAGDFEITVSLDERNLLNTELSKAENIISYRLRITTPEAKLTLDQPFNLEVECSHRMTFVLYYIISKGNIVYSGSEKLRSKGKLLHNLQLPREATKKMIPRSNVLVATVINNTFVYDSVPIRSEHLSNNIQLKLKEDEHDLRADNTIELSITGPSNSYVALASYDRSLLQHRIDHDISQEDILKMFVEKNANSISSALGSIGIFVSAGNMRIEAVEDKSARTGLLPNHGLPGQLYPHRSDFLESWLWKNITLPKNGFFKLAAPTPDNIATWYLTGFSISAENGFGIIKKPLMITTSLPFYIVDNLPYSLRRGEVVALQFTVFNTFSTECNASVTMYNTNDQFEFLNQPGAKFHTISTIVSSTDSDVVTFLVKAKTLGEMKVHLIASTPTSTGPEVDALLRFVRILPENIMMNSSQARFFSHNSYNTTPFEFLPDVDRFAINTSIRTDLKVYPDLISKISQNLDNLLETSKDTGDQNMMNFAQCFVILKYEESIGGKAGEVYKKAVNLLQTNYQSELKFRKIDGSFGAWMHKGGSVFVTAFVGQWLVMAEKYLEDIEDVISKAFDWLASKQQDNGSFIEDGPIVYNDIQTNNRKGIALTSFVMVAFVKMQKVKNKHQAIIEKGMAYIESHLETIENSFDLSIATYALYLNDRQTKDSALNKLIGFSTMNDRKFQRYWNTRESPIETAAFALLSFTEANQISNGFAIIGWLVNQTYATGTFHNSFDTAFGLLAVSTFNQLITTEKNDFNINIRTRGENKDYPINFQQKGIFSIQINVTHQEKFNVIVSGMGIGLLQVVSHYEMDMAKYQKQSFNLMLTKLNSTSATELKLRVCSKYKSELGAEPSNSALVEVNLPSGYVVHSNPISYATTANPIQQTRILYGGTTVENYYEKLDNTENCFTITAYRVFDVANRRSAYVKVHDVYKPKRYAIKLYEVEKQDVCDFCCQGSCPPSCEQYVGRIETTC